MLKQSVAALSALLIGFATPVRADQIVSQPPCQFCLEFTNAEPIDGFSLTIRLSAPGRGTAVVTAHGSLVCTNTISSLATIDLGAQIVRDNEAADSTSGPGRLVVFAQLPGSGATTFNLASTRVFPIAAAGTTDFRLRLRRSVQSPNTICRLRDVALTVHFVN